MFQMSVADVVFICGHGVVATGQATAGSLRVGDEVLINGLIHAKVTVGDVLTSAGEQAWL